MQIAGTASSEDVSFYGTWINTGTPDIIYVSETALNNLTNQTTIMQMELNIDEDRLEAVNQQIKGLLQSASGQAEIWSRADMETEFMTTMQTMRILGNGASFVLILAGMLNFANVMVTGVYSRRRELAVMAGIGMTRRQIRRLLIAEGGYYAGISTLLILTAGSGMLVLVAKWVPALADYARFEYPAGLVCALIVAIFVICLSVPAIVYHTMGRESLAGQLRAAE